MFKFKNISFYIVFCFVILCSGSKLYSNLLKWGLKNGMWISDKINIHFNSVNDKYYVSNSTIEQDELIMKIPFKMFVNTVNLLSSSSVMMQTIYTELLNYYNEKGPESKDDSPSARVQEIFLSLVAYFQKEKTYKKVKSYFKTFQNNVDNFPVFYNAEQLRLLLNTSLGGQVELAKYTLDDEISNIQRICNKTIDQDKYYRLRTLTVSKSLEVNGTISLIPFIDFFQTNPIKFSVDYFFDEEEMLIIKAVRKIENNEVLIIKTTEIPNTNGLIFYGKTYEGIESMSSYSLPVFHPRWMIENEVDNEDLKINSNRIELMDEDFFSKAKPFYEKLCVKMGKALTDKNIYGLFLENMKRFQQDYSYVSDSDYYNAFFSRSDAINVKRVVDLEKRLIDNRIRYVEEIVKAYEDYEKRKKSDL